MTLAIMHPWPHTIAGTSAGVGADNLLTPHPREAFVGSAAMTDIALDLGVERACDTFLLGYTSVVPGVAATVANGLGAGAPEVASTTAAHSYRRAVLRHIVWQLPFAITNRYVSLRVAGSAAIGVVAAGLAIRPVGAEFGSGRPMSDTSRVGRLFDGGFAIDRGATAGGWQWTMPLTDEERERMYALSLDAGTGSTVLVVEDGHDGLGGNEAIHWGLLTKLEPYARQAAGENVWAMQVQDW